MKDAAGSKHRLLHGEIVRVRKVRFLLTANNAGHVGGIGDVARKLGQRDLVRAALVFTAVSIERQADGGAVQRLNVKCAARAADDEMPAGE